MRRTSSTIGPGRLLPEGADPRRVNGQRLHHRPGRDAIDPDRHAVGAANQIGRDQRGDDRDGHGDGIEKIAGHLQLERRAPR